MSKYKDPDSWKYGGIKRRDFQHSHDGPEELPSKKKSKKLGRKRARCDHQYETYNEINWRVGGVPLEMHYLRCIKCGRKEVNVIR